MYLKDYRLVPGIIIDVNDPKFIGRIKADAPGLFDSKVMSKEGLPWVYPFIMPGYQRFSKLSVDSKVWIMVNENNTEFWYWPMFELHDDTKDIISGDESDYEESEVLLSRNMGDNGVYIYYRPSQGIVIKQGENTSITLTNDNQIIMKSGDGQVTLKNNQVYIGDANTDDMQQAILGKDLVKYLNNFKKAMNQVATAANGGYTVNIAPALQMAVKTLENPENLLAKKTFCD